MSNTRDVTLYVAQILDQTACHQEMVEMMKKVIDLNPVLSHDERNLLSAGYKELISVQRNGLRILAEMAEHEEGKANEHRIAQITAVRDRIVQELEEKCNELISLIDNSLLPVATDPESRLFYQKLRGDYLRYIYEARNDPAVAERAKESYNAALEIARSELEPCRPACLGVILNYTVFLFEVMGQAAEAIELSKKTYNEYCDVVDQNSDDSYSEATLILQNLRDNVALWSEHTK